MGDNNTPNVSDYSDLQKQLAQAPAFSVTGQDFDAQAAAQKAQAAAAQANAPQQVYAPTGGTDGPRPTVPQDMRQNPTNTGSGTFGDKLAASLRDLKTQAGANLPALLQAPNGFSNAMIGATMDTLAKGPGSSVPEAAPTSGPGSNNFQGDTTAPTTSVDNSMPKRTLGQKFNDNMSDLAAAHGDSLIGGATATAAAQNTREREQMKDKMQMAVSNAQMVHEQALTHKLGDDAMQENISTGKASIDAMTAPPPSGGSAGTLDDKGKTSDELNKMIQDGTFKPSTQTAYPDGRVMEGKDANGLPIWRTTYSVVTPPKSMALGDLAKDINKNLNTNYSSDQVLPGIKVNDLIQKSNNAKAANDARDNNLKEQGLKVDDLNSMVASKTIGEDTRVMKAMSGAPVGKDGQITPYASVMAFNALNASGAFDKSEKNPKPLDKQATKIWAGGGGADGLKNFNTMNENYAKETQKSTATANDLLTKAAESPALVDDHYDTIIEAAQAKIASKDPSITTQDRQQAKDLLALATSVKADKAAEKAEGKAKEKPYEGDENLSGLDYLASLPKESQGTVKAMGEGRMPLVRIEYLAAKNPDILNAVTKAYPDFNGGKIKAYVDTTKEFTSTKPNTAGGQLNAGGTAMGHLRELRDLNTNASHIPHTPAWTAYQNKADTLATELAKFYGDSTVPAIAAIKETLTSTLPGNREAAITTQAQSMGDKLASFEQTWKNAAPSPAYEAPMPQISDSQKRDFASLNNQYAVEHPEYAPKPVAGTQQNTSQGGVRHQQPPASGGAAQQGAAAPATRLPAPRPNMTLLQKPDGTKRWASNSDVDNLIKNYGATRVQ